MRNAQCHYLGDMEVGRSLQSDEKRLPLKNHIQKAHFLFLFLVDKRNSYC